MKIKSLIQCLLLSSIVSCGKAEASEESNETTEHEKTIELRSIDGITEYIFHPKSFRGRHGYLSGEGWRIDATPSFRLGNVLEGPPVTLPAGNLKAQIEIEFTPFWGDFVESMDEASTIGFAKLGFNLRKQDDLEYKNKFFKEILVQELGVIKKQATENGMGFYLLSERKQQKISSSTFDLTDEPELLDIFIKDLCPGSSLAISKIIVRIWGAQP